MFRLDVLPLLFLVVAVVSCSAFQPNHRGTRIYSSLNQWNNFISNSEIVQENDTADPVEFRKGRNVFFVDDELDIRDAVASLLIDTGYQVKAFAGGQDVLQELANGQMPDCIVSDVRMPGMDGMELLNTLRRDERLVKIPVVLLTAKRQTHDRIAGYNAGADAYLPKPFDPEELLAIIDNCILHSENLNGNSVQVQDLQRELNEIKILLTQKGGAGPGMNGFVQKTDVFLAPDEQKVLELLCDGLQTKEIASRIFLSKRRVEQLLTRMFRKTGSKNRTGLVRWAISTGNVQV